MKKQLRTQEKLALKQETFSYEVKSQRGCEFGIVSYKKQALGKRSVVEITVTNQHTQNGGNGRIQSQRFVPIPWHVTKAFTTRLKLNYYNLMKSNFPSGKNLKFLLI